MYYAPVPLRATEATVKAACCFVESRWAMSRLRLPEQVGKPYASDVDGDCRSEGAEGNWVKEMVVKEIGSVCVRVCRRGY